MVDLEVMTPAFARGWAELPNELRHQVLLNFLGEYEQVVTSTAPTIRAESGVFSVET